MSTSDDTASAVAAAVAFVATQAGGAERILKQHYALPSGMCAGCQVVPTRYPCTAARIAELARRLAADPEPAPTHLYLSQRTAEHWRQLATEFWGKS